MPWTGSPLAARVLRAQRLVAVVQLLPVAVLFATSMAGLLSADDPRAVLAYVVPVAALGGCLWQLRQSWQRPLAWGIGGAYTALLAGLATGAVVGFGAAAEYGWSPGIAVPLAIGSVVVAPGLVLLAAYGLRRYALGGAGPAELAGSPLEVPFWLAGSGAVLVVGPRTVSLRIARSNYRTVIVRVDRTEADLERLHVQQVQTLEEPAEIELGGLSGTARAPAGAEVVHLQAGRARWSLPLADAGPVVELIRLRKARLREPWGALGSLRNGPSGPSRGRR